MKYKILFLKKLDISGKQALWDNGAGIIVAGGHSEDVFIKEIRKHQIDAIMCRIEIVTPAMVDASPSLKVIARHGMGLDDTNVEYTAKKGIQVVYVSLGSYDSVAERMIMLMLMATRRCKHVDREFRNGNFDIRYTLQDTFKLESLTLGILGCGRIGQIIASKAALGFGMNVIGYDPHARQESVKAPVKLLKNRDDVLARVDSISLDLSSLPSTHGSIGHTAFQKVKPEAFFINYSRGDVVVEADLIKALQEGLILGVNLDVFSKEPTGYTNPMLEMDDVTMTPHTAVTTRQAVVRRYTTATRGIMGVMNRKPITFLGNKID